MQKPFRVLLYYHYTSVEDPVLLQASQQTTASRLGLRGRIVVSPEGINGTVGGETAACEAYMRALWKDLRFADMVFKVDESATHAFSRLRVQRKPELVHTAGADLALGTLPKGTYMSPQDFRHHLLHRSSDVLLLDVRARFEHALGKFKGARTLPIDHFRAFFDPSCKVADALAPYKHKPIITYCTGGVRCEKASAFLLKQGFTSVYQLRGGILGYAFETDGAGFEGTCYVFDERLTVPINGRQATVVARCYRCGVACERMINCANARCNRHVALCEACGWRGDGTCSSACQASSRKRSYDGTGTYFRWQTKLRSVQ